MEPLVHAYFSAWNAKDANVLRALLSDDCRLRDWDVSVEGGDKVVAANEKIWEAVPKIAIDILEIHCAGESSATAEIIVKLNDDAGAELKVADVIGFNEAGKITFVRAYKG